MPLNKETKPNLKIYMPFLQNGNIDMLHKSGKEIFRYKG